MIKTFISHTSKDHGLVNWLKVRLEKENLGLDIFVDDGSVFIGDDPQKMIDEVKRSIIFIPIFSQESVKKEFVLNETKTALNNQTTYLFPIRYNCEREDIPEEISIKFLNFDSVKGKIYEDFSNEREWERNFQNLRRAIFNRICDLGLLKERDKEFYQDCEQLDLIIKRDEPTTLEIKTAIDVYLREEKYQKYFFSKLENIKWLKYLRIYGFLKSNPKPVESKDSPGYYSVPHWYALDYLEKVSEKLDEDDHEDIQQILCIIREVSNLKDENGKQIDNYRTWWYFVKILLNIPNEKIPIDIIQLIPVWLESRFDNTLPGADIGKKLLPKFLNSEDPEDWIKAEKIVEAITSLEPEQLHKEETKIYKRERETLLKSYWLVESFKVNSTKVGEKCSENLIFVIADRLKEVFRQKHPDHYRDIEYKGKSYRISVKHLSDFEFKYCVGVITGEENTKKKSIEDLVKGLSVKTEKILHFKIKDCRDIKSFIILAKQRITQHPNLKNINGELDERLHELYKEIYSEYSYIWFDSMSRGPAVPVHGAKTTLTLILRDITLAKAKKGIDTTHRIFDRFLGSEYQYPLFRRIVLHVIGKRWNDYKGRFWEILDEQNGEFLFENPDFEPELYTLLETNISKFKFDEKERLKRIIERGPQRYLPKQNREKYIAYWKQKWYSALKADPDFAELYKQYRQITQIEEEKPFKKFEVLKGSTISPLSKEDILTISNVELALHLKTFRTRDEWKGPTVDGLSGVLEIAVQENPDKFTKDLVPFLDVGYFYVHHLLLGIKDAWNQKKSVEWGEVFKFVRKYVDREEFWKEKFKIDDDGWNVDHKWVIGSIGELVQDGTKDDAWAFQADHNAAAEEILFLILDKLEAEGWEVDDAVTYTLNSANGKIITALLFLALRIARLKDKKEIKKEVKWSKEIEQKFNQLVQDGIIEAYTLLGQYMANFFYLNKDWVKKKIETIYETKEKNLWAAFMEGYLLGGRLYTDLYKLMKKHYFKAIDYDFKESHTNQRLVQHISLQYLQGKEEINDVEGLFRKLLDRWEPSQVEEIISFFWMQRDYLGENLKDKPKVKKPDELKDMQRRIIEFWRWVYENKFKQKPVHRLTDEDKHILSDLSKLTVFLSEIDAENFQRLRASARYVHIGFNSPFFIEYLDNLKTKESAKFIGEIFLEVLVDFTPEYDQRHIRSIVEYLYISGEKENADKICNTYGSRGFEFLRDLYDKYQKEEAN